MEVFIISCSQTCTSPCRHEHEGQILITGMYWPATLRVFTAILGYRAHRTGNCLHLQCAYMRTDTLAIMRQRRRKLKASSDRKLYPEPLAWAASVLTTDPWGHIHIIFSICQRCQLLHFIMTNMFLFPAARRSNVSAAGRSNVYVYTYVFYSLSCCE